MPAHLPVDDAMRVHKSPAELAQTVAARVRSGFGRGRTIKGWQIQKAQIQMPFFMTFIHPLPPRRYFTSNSRVKSILKAKPSQLSGDFLDEYETALRVDLDRESMCRVKINLLLLETIEEFLLALL